MDTSTSDSQALPAGTRLEEFVIERVLGAGGFGITYLARDTRLEGQAERTFRLWLRHPFRGKRPPTGKGHGGSPRFSYGAR